ncbi:hypothetical protein KQX54_016216 [Cotesia glomerata]|uniref:Uncharacterized protein n=1 Tax=Cotesia glomerata TaxID=32391 RepID=A0AAV7IZP3_COTGL|nr:hypothetical protein KQX54_016216 [Cotesia glomerata]
MAFYKDYYSDLWELNLSTMTWKNIDNRGSLIPRAFETYSVTVSPAGQLFTFGGSPGSTREIKFSVVLVFTQFGLLFRNSQTFVGSLFFTT